MVYELYLKKAVTKKKYRSLISCTFHIHHALQLFYEVHQAEVVTSEHTYGTGSGPR